MSNMKKRHSWLAAVGVFLGAIGLALLIGMLLTPDQTEKPVVHHPTSAELGFEGPKPGESTQERVYRTTCNVLRLGGVEASIPDLVESGIKAGFARAGAENAIREAAQFACPELSAEVNRILPN